MKLIKGILTVLVSVLFISCEKDDIIIIDGNQAPPDHTIENITKENYVNKLYISVLGRQATTAEFDAGMAIIEKNNLSVANREELVNVIFEDDQYFHNEYEIIRNNILNSGDTADVTLFILIFEQTKMSTNNPTEIATLDEFIGKLEDMQDIIPDLESGSIDFPEVHRRCINNHFYDEINMGTENFVVSLYQNFLFRYPTVSELDAGKLMVDGSESTLFYQIGRNKGDFMDIFLSSREYLEGQVRSAYLRFLFREPTDEESTSMTTLYEADLDFKAMQLRILKTDEYVGI